MSAVVYCGKRSSSIFADELLPPSSSPSSSSHHGHGHSPAAKRSRFSPPPQHRREALLQQLRFFFPNMDPQRVYSGAQIFAEEKRTVKKLPMARTDEDMNSRVADTPGSAYAGVHGLASLVEGMLAVASLDVVYVAVATLLERALEASGDDLDSAIRSLKELQLESTQTILPATGCTSENGQPTAVQPSVEGTVTNGGVDTATEQHQPVAGSHQASNSGSEWVELFVNEMSNASDMDDARARASRALEALTKSIVEGAGAEAAQSLHQENMVLKEQMSAILSQNALLKRAVAIQHERQKEYDERSQEVQGLKQLVLQYQDQLRTLEINNYALQMHLKQAQQNNSMPGRYNPDVF